MNRLSLLAILVLAAPGCGDDGHDDDHVDAAGGADAGDTDDGGVESDAAGATATVFAVGTDYTGPGVFSTIDVPDLDVTEGALDGVASSDPVLRALDGRLYIVNRFGADNITILEGDGSALIAQISTGAGTNPQDVAVDGATIYVAALGSPDVLVLDADNPDDGVVDTIDLSSLDPDDGNPNCSAIVRASDRLYVVCGILDDEDMFLTPRGPGKVAVVDPVSGSIETTLDLTNENPFGAAIASPPASTLAGDILIPTVPDFGDLTLGCVERIAVGNDPSAEGCLIDNSDLGGYASGLAFAGDDLAYIAVTEGFDQDDFGPLGSVLRYDAATTSLDETPVTPDTQRAFDVAACPTGHLAISDAAGGIRIYDPSDTELTTDPLDIGLPVVSTVCP